MSSLPHKPEFSTPSYDPSKEWWIPFMSLSDQGKFEIDPEFWKALGPRKPQAKELFRLAFSKTPESADKDFIIKLEKIMVEADKKILQYLPLHAIVYAVKSRGVPEGEIAGIEKRIIDLLICRRLNADQSTNDESSSEASGDDMELYGQVANFYTSVTGKDPPK